MTKLLNHEFKAGKASSAVVDWPAASRIQRLDHRPTLVMLAHPRCPCTRASIEELAWILARCENRVTAYVIFATPTDQTGNWMDSDLVRSASHLPAVHVLQDEDGRESSLFGAFTSGQTLLYDSRGHLVFEGGITISRGHSGDNPGAATVIAIINHGSSEGFRIPVFGCALCGKRNS